jgi:hypothetical protein
MLSPPSGWLEGPLDHADYKSGKCRDSTPAAFVARHNLEFGIVPERVHKRVSLDTGAPDRISELAP